jgi:hypothetical protein
MDRGVSRRAGGVGWYRLVAVNGPWAISPAMPTWLQVPAKPAAVTHARSSTLSSLNVGVRLTRTVVSCTAPIRSPVPSCGPTSLALAVSAPGAQPMVHVPAMCWLDCGAIVSTPSSRRVPLSA